MTDGSQATWATGSVLFSLLWILCMNLSCLILSWCELLGSAVSCGNVFLS